MPHDVTFIASYIVITPYKFETFANTTLSNSF